MYSPINMHRNNYYYCENCNGICNEILSNNIIVYSCGKMFHSNCLKRSSLSIINPKCPICAEGNLINNKAILDEDDYDYSIPPINVITIILSCMGLFLIFIFGTTIK